MASWSCDWVGVARGHVTGWVWPVLTMSGLVFGLDVEPMVDSLLRSANDSIITTRKMLCCVEKDTHHITYGRG